VCRVQYLTIGGVTPRSIRRARSNIVPKRQRRNILDGPAVSISPTASADFSVIEIDMKLCTVLFEAKLTEGIFQNQNATIVEGYRDLKDVFEARKLPRRRQEYVSYQLLRNLLAAYVLIFPSACSLMHAGQT
jgi:hypothetical protein